MPRRCPACICVDGVELNLRAPVCILCLCLCLQPQPAPFFLSSSLASALDSYTDSHLDSFLATSRDYAICRTLGGAAAAAATAFPGQSRFESTCAKVHCHSCNALVHIVLTRYSQTHSPDFQRRFTLLLKYRVIRKRVGDEHDILRLRLGQPDSHCRTREEHYMVWTRSWNIISDRQ